jgi:Asp-tRNA(Asn)/Glu-tRNA(Gln) amidotransferase C subunit
VVPRVTAEDIERLGALAGLQFPQEDLEPLAESLVAHLRQIEPLLRKDLAAVEPALRFDPAAHG